MAQPTILTYPSNLPSELASVPIIDLRGSLPTNPKYTWESLKGLRNIENITTIVFHHDAISKDSTKAYDDVTLAARIAQSHINSTKNIPGGDAGFPYHCWVRNGKIYITNNPLAFTYGVASNNDYTIHVCVSGEYTKDQLTDADRNALYAAYFLYKAWMPKFKVLLGHKELNPTSCPGYDMNKVKTDLQTIERQMLEQTDYNSSDSAQRAICYAFAERVDDLGKRRSDPKWGNSANVKLMWLAPALTQLGVTDEITPQYIVDYVKRVYDNSYNAKFSGEAFRKLGVLAKLAKEKGLLP